MHLKFIPSRMLRKMWSIVDLSETSIGAGSIKKVVKVYEKYDKLKIARLDFSLHYSKSIYGMHLKRVPSQSERSTLSIIIFLETSTGAVIIKRSVKCYHVWKVGKKWAFWNLGVLVQGLVVSLLVMVCIWKGPHFLDKIIMLLFVAFMGKSVGADIIKFIN